MILLFSISLSSIFNLTSSGPLAPEAQQEKKLTLQHSTPLDLPTARKKLTEGKRKFKLPSNFNSEEFRQVANGFFQAEGHISCRIRNKSFYPVFVLTQNFSFQTLDFFITLWFVLGSNTSLTINKSQSGKLVIRLSSESWNLILGTIFNYFALIYGEKYVAFKKLLDIRRLTKSNGENTIFSHIHLAIRLAYSLSLDGVNRKLTLPEQLTIFGINTIKSPIPMPIYTDNFNIPSVLFLIGFIVGDCSLLIRLRLVESGSVWIIPLLSIAQLNNAFNPHLFTMFASLFKSLGINVNIKNCTELEKKHVLSITIEGIDNIFQILLPIFTKYFNYFYWKQSQCELMIRIAKLINAKAHLTLYGFISILEIIYSYPNNRDKSKEFWVDVIKAWFNSQANLMKSGENFIQSVNSRNSVKGVKEIVAWKCVFPKGVPIKSRQFGFTTYVNSEQALKSAIEYRDKAIQSWVDSLKKL